MSVQRTSRSDELYIAGEQRAERVLQRIAAGIANPDEILFGLTNAMAEDGRMIDPSPRLRGFMRRLQKTIERGAP